MTPADNQIQQYHLVEKFGSFVKKLKIINQYQGHENKSAPDLTNFVKVLFPDRTMTEKRNPMQLKTITKLLNLPNFQVVKVLEHNKEDIHLYLSNR